MIRHAPKAAIGCRARQPFRKGNNKPDAVFRQQGLDGLRPSPPLEDHDEGHCGWGRCCGCLGRCRRRREHGLAPDIRPSIQPVPFLSPTCQFLLVRLLDRRTRRLSTDHVLFGERLQTALPYKDVPARRIICEAVEDLRLARTAGVAPRPFTILDRAIEPRESAAPRKFLKPFLIAAHGRSSVGFVSQFSCTHPTSQPPHWATGTGRPVRVQ
jgi:hypothetical protein